MACNFSFSSSLSFDFIPTKPKSRNPRNPQKFQLFPSFSCKNQVPNHENEEKNPKTQKTHLSLLTVPITLTIISTSLATNPSFAATKVASDKKKKTQKKPQEAWTPEQIKKWSKDLPVVSSRIAYTEILSLKNEGRLKHVIKSPSASLRQKAEPVLVVLEDSRVLRTVLPSLDSNKRFWDSWDELKVDSLYVNSYTPPVKKLEVPAPYLGFLWKFPESMLSMLKPKKESKRALEIRRVREEFKMQRKEESERLRKEREMIEKTIRIQKKEEERRRKREMRKRKTQESLADARENSQYMADVWDNLAQDSNVATALGIVFFDTHSTNSTTQ